MTDPQLGVLMLVMFMGHIYMGTVGMEGALQAMKTGYVDETWAKEHHELWYNETKAKAGAAPVASGGGAAAVPSAPRARD